MHLVIISNKSINITINETLLSMNYQYRDSYEILKLK